MDWEQYLAARKRLLGGEGASPIDKAPMLMMNSEAIFDNGTRYLQNQKGTDIPNSFPGIFEGAGSGGSYDFVWYNAGQIRGHIGISGGGHPALAGFNTIHCAGEVHDGWIRFKSGHYHPKQANAIPYMCDLIETTCRAALDRDAMVDKISGMKLVIYCDHSKTETFKTTFAQLAGEEHRETTSLYPEGGKTAAIPIPGKSRPIPIGGNSGGSRPIPIGGNSGGSRYTSTSFGTTSPQASPRLSRGSFPLDVDLQPAELPSATRGPARWQPDPSNCTKCGEAFTVFKRRHHCRRCGYVFCHSCSSRKKVVRFPANEENKAITSTSEVRVCDGCFVLKDPL